MLAWRVVLSFLIAGLPSWPGLAQALHLFTLRDALSKYGAQSSINCYDLRFQHVSSYFFLIGPVHSPTQYVHWASRSDPACCCDSAPAVGKPCRWRPVPFASRFFCFWHKAKMMMFLWMGLFRPAICCRPKSICRATKSPKRKKPKEPMSRTSAWIPLL